MKNWLRNLRIKGKLNLMIGVALTALILLGLTANFLIRTTKVVNIMLIAQRDYMMDYHRSLENFYQFQAGQAHSAAKLESAIKNIKLASEKLDLFKDPASLFKKYENDLDGLVNEVKRVYGSAVQDKNGGSASNDATLLIKRTKLFQTLNIEAITTSSKAAADALKLADNIKQVFESFQSSMTEQGKQESIASLERYLEQMAEYEKA
jgi:hypothetical protein